MLESAALTNHAVIEFVVLINERLWQGLSDTDRAVLTAAAIAVEADPERAARVARNAMWDALRPMFSETYEVAEAWNAFTYRTAADGL